MKWTTLLLVLLLLPSAHAAWHYAGDTFTQDGILYSVEGSDPEIVLLGAGGRNYLLRLGECVRNGLLEYCYVDTAYPDDDDHIKFEAGDVYYGYDITIEEVEPDLSIDIDISEDNPLLNEEVAITVTLENTGEYRIASIKYEDILPSGLVGLGEAVSGKFSYTKNALSPEELDRFTYRFKPAVYGSLVLTPTIRYTSEGVVFNESISKKTITVASPVVVTRYITPTLDLEKTGIYEINITNQDEEDVDVDVAITVAQGVTVGSPVGAKLADGVYVAERTLGEDDELRITLPFTAGGPGNYLFSAAITTTKDGVTSTTRYNNTMTSTAKGILPTIKISPTKTTYAGGSDITITGVLKNDNLETGFRKVQAALSIPGVMDVVTKTQGPLGKGDTVTLFTERLTLPSVTNTTTFTARLSGSYETTSGKSYTFAVEKPFTVAFLVEALNVTRKLNATSAPRGGNLTVTVTAKNVYGAYATIDTSERFPEGIRAVSGLTYAEISLERDASQQLYIYQIEIPADYPLDTIELVTVARVQGQDDPQEYAMSIPVSGTPPGTDTPEPVVEPEEIPFVDVDGDGIADHLDDDISKPGIFTRAWNWLKGFFS